LLDFKKNYDLFGDYVELVPMYKFKNLVGEFVERFLKEHCFYKGVYCAVDFNNINSIDTL